MPARDKEAKLFTDYVVATTEELEASNKRKELRDILTQWGPRELVGLHGERGFSVHPDPKIIISPENLEVVRKVTGEEFDKLIECKKVYAAVKGCREIASAILAAAKLNKFLGATEKESAPYIRIA